MAPNQTSQGQYVPHAGSAPAAMRAALPVGQGSGLLESLRAALGRAGDDGISLLERARLLRQVSSGVDTYVMTCMGGLKRKMDSLAPAARGPWEDVLAGMRAHVKQLGAQQGQCYNGRAQASLDDAGLKVLSWAQVSPAQRQVAEEFYNQHIHPVLTPLSVDPGHPFPLISNLSLSLAVALQYPQDDRKIFCRIKIPAELPQWVALDEGPGPRHFMSLAELIRGRLDRLFSDMHIVASSLFRVTRTADFLLQRADTDDLLEMLADEAIRRRFEKVVRVEHQAGADAWILDFLSSELDVPREDFYEIPCELACCDLEELVQAHLQGLRHCR